MKNLPTVIVGIPAFNEEKNIANLIRLVLLQKHSNHHLDQILVISDGSKDQTVNTARSIKSSKLKVVDRKKRLGGGKTKDEIMRKTKSDILVLLDADVAPMKNNFLNEIVKPILAGASLVGANTIPLPPKNFFGKVVANSHMFKKDIYKQIADADNVYLCHGRGRAFAKNLYNKLTLPDSSGEDAYSYLFAKSKGYKFSFAENAKVWYKVSTEIKDREIQSKRFLKGKENLKKLFPKDFVRENFHIPKLAVLKTAIIYFFKHPILITSYFLWIIYILAFSKLKIKDTGKWQMSPSSKILT